MKGYKSFKNSNKKIIINAFCIKETRQNYIINIINKNGKNECREFKII